MYDDTALPNGEQSPSSGNWHPLPRRPSKETGDSDEYEAFNGQDDYGSISFSYVKEEMTVESQLPDPHTAQTTLIPMQWKNCWERSRMAILLALAGSWLLFGIVLLSQHAAMLSELRKLSLSSVQESFDSSTITLMIHKLNSSLITKLQFLEEHINKKSEATNKNMNKQLSRLEEKMNSTLQYLKGTSSSSAPLPWKEFQGHHYYFSRMEKHWGNANEFCGAMNAHQLIINNEEEQDFVVSQMSTSVWLGLSDSTSEGTWSWVDGSPVTDTFWRDGEPNNTGDEDCAVLYKGKKWNDIPCSRTVSFVCEKE